MEWIYPEGITKQDILNNKGFVYLITNKLTNKKYIGKKFVHTYRTKIVNKKKKKVWTVSDWETYTGSSDDLNNDIALYGEEHFEKEILSVHRTKTECNYREVELQMLNDVLRARKSDGDYAYYNRNILHKYFRNNIK